MLLLPWLVLEYLARNVDAVLAADKFLEEVQRDERAPVLLLRSLGKPTKRLTGYPGYNKAKPSDKVLDWVPGEPFAVVDALAWALSDSMGPVVMFQHPGYFRKGQYLSLPSLDETWRTLVGTAARNCRTILLLPDQSPGVAEEVDWLMRTGLFHKLFVIMPPDVPKQVTFSYRWQTQQKRWSKQGFNLPPFEGHGILYRPNPDLSIAEAVSLDGDVSNVATALWQLQPDTPAGVPAHTLVEFAADLILAQNFNDSSVSPEERHAFTTHLEQLSDDEVKVTCEKYQWIAVDVSSRPRLLWYASAAREECCRRFGEQWVLTSFDKARCIGHFG